MSLEGSRLPSLKDKHAAQAAALEAAEKAKAEAEEAVEAEAQRSKKQPKKRK